MTAKRSRGTVALWMAVFWIGSIGAQSQDRIAQPPDRIQNGAGAVKSAVDADRDVIGAIEDPSTGDLWLRLRNRNHPGGPGRLVLAPRSGSKVTRESSQAGQRTEIQSPVIHRGDTLTVEEHSAVADVRLEAMALEPAVTGGYFKARLKIGGNVVLALAVSVGHAVLAPRIEFEP